MGADPQLTHLALHVVDIDRSLAFYQAFCGLQPIHDRGEGVHRVVWLSPKERSWALVLMAGGAPARQSERDYRHWGFAVADRQAVTRLAEQAREEGCLVWPAREEGWPLGFYCGIRDPDGHVIEFSYGQPRAIDLADAGPP